MDKKKKLIPILIGAGILVVGIIIFFIVKNNEEKNDPNNVLTITVPKGVEEKKPDITKSAPSEPSGKVSRGNQLKATINGNLHVIDLEGGFVDTNFKKLIPFSISLENRDDNKLVGSFGGAIDRNDKSFDKIQIGDVMLYEGDKIVIFYKEVDSPTEQYTKIGNIEQLEPIDGNVTIEFDYI